MRLRACAPVGAKYKMCKNLHNIELNWFALVFVKLYITLHICKIATVIMKKIITFSDEK